MMTDLVDAPMTAELPSLEPDHHAAADDRSGAEPDCWFLAGVLVGAAAIHLAMAPSHLGESSVEGAAFLVAAWVQLGLAVAVVVRPARWALGAVIVANVAFVAAWVVSRTVGLPFGEHSGHAGTISLVDGACVGLEMIAVALAGCLLAKPAAAVVRSTGLALAGVLGAFVLTSAAIASPSARDHAAASHGDTAGHSTEAVATDGHDHGTQATAEDDLGFSALQNGQMGNHEHRSREEAAPVDEEIDPETAGELAGQLALTAPLVEAYPTLGAARAAGYWQAGPFAPGLGVHFNSGDFGAFNADGVMDPEDIANPMLIFDGLTDDAPLAGFMYMMYQETEPEGFVGPLDRWHYHTQVCIVSTPDGIRTPFGADLTGVTEEMCAGEGGALIDFTGYMVHVWTVPGYESDMGTFSDLNPKITCPDRTYHTIPITEIGDASTICRNP